MSAQLRRPLVAGLIALAVLLIAQWFDAGVLADAQRQAGRTYDVGPFWNSMGIAHVLTAAGVIALAMVAWWSRSLLVGVGYAIVGGFLVFLPTITFVLASSVNGAPPLAPAPIATTLNRWFSTLASGVSGSIFTIAGGMFVSGLVVIWLVLRGRAPSGADAAMPMTEPPAESKPV
jgi:hypothetical protein